MKSEFEPRDYKFGNHTFKLDWAGMKHILERHHPKLWDGSVKNKQSYFEAKTKVEDLQKAITDILKQNRGTLIQRGTNSRFQIEAEFNGVRYTLGIENGRVRQFYTP